MKKASGPEVVTSAEASQMPKPAEIQAAMGELFAAAREGCWRSASVLVCGSCTRPRSPKSWGRRACKTRAANRHRHGRGSMTLGGRRVQVRRPRMCIVEDERELPVQTYEFFADRDPLPRAVTDRMLVGMSTRKFAVVDKPVGEEVEQGASATSMSTVSEVFATKTRTALGDLMG